MLLVKSDDQTKMEEGEYYAIETFGSTGRGRIVESVRTRGYGGRSLNMALVGRMFALCKSVRCTSRATKVRTTRRKCGGAELVYHRLNSAKTLLATITKTFGTLPFCRRYLDRAGESKYLLAVSVPERCAAVY